MAFFHYAMDEFTVVPPGLRVKGTLWVLNRALNLSGGKGALTPGGKDIGRGRSRQ